MNSALNAPLRAEIELLSATPEELDNLQVQLASQETFARYGLDRPFYLQGLSFQIVRSGSTEGNYVSVTSTAPITEPFLTFLVEAMWSRGRLLREYTVLLDPPTFAPPAAAETRPAVEAPQRTAPADSGRIERPARETQAAEQEPAPQRRPTPAPAPRTEPRPEQVAPQRPFDTAAGEEYIVQRRETLWGIATRFRPDSRLTMNQTMLAIFEANPQAFGGNINILRAGARLRIPSADDIFRIDRTYALNEARRQHAEWSGMPAPAPTSRPAETTTRPSLQLVPPDEEPVGAGAGSERTTQAATEAEPEMSPREREILDRIAELKAADVPQQRALIEIRDNELASLRRELANIRGEVYEPPVEEMPVAEEELPVEGEVAADDLAAGEVQGEEPEEAAEAETESETTIKPPSNIISSPTRKEPSLVDKIIGALTSIWAIIGGAVIVAAGVLFWFVRRGRGEDDDAAWTSAGMSAPDLDDTHLSSTEALRAPSRDEESIVVVEQGSGIRPLDDDTLDSPGPHLGLGARSGDTGEYATMEDTFSSETAVNLDQSDPIAEADFHMAYGLYDQAADLINGALDLEPERLDLLTKLCEIYFVWGNRDAFVDAARRVEQAASGGDSGEWDKIVIMGQQIAADDELFAGAGVAGATKAVDLSFDADDDEASALDMDFGTGEEAGGDIIDLGAGPDDEGIDFDFSGGDAAESADYGGGLDFDITRESPTVEAPAEDETAEMPDAASTRSTPTIEEQFAGFGGTSELPSISDAVDEAIADSGQVAEETAEINLDELGLDLDSLAETEVASLDDLDDLEDTSLAADEDELDITGRQQILEDTGINETLEDTAAQTGRNPEVDPDSTGVRKRLDTGDTGIHESFDLDDVLTSSTRLRLAPDETGQHPVPQEEDADTDIGFDESLLDATGRTQILPEDFAVDTGVDTHGMIADDEATLLASLDDDDESDDDDSTMLSRTLNEEADFDFAKTEALPKDVFTGNMNLDETGELPAVASTDVDLDLDDLTAALKVSEMGDTVDMPRDDATVEHRRFNIEDDETAEVPTMSLSPEDMSDDLHEARTMTEVGTKLDLARAYVDMGDPGGARSILEEVLDEGDESQRQQAQQLLDSLPG